MATSSNWLLFYLPGLRSVNAHEVTSSIWLLFYLPGLRSANARMATSSIWLLFYLPGLRSANARMATSSIWLLFYLPGLRSANACMATSSIWLLFYLPGLRSVNARMATSSIWLLFYLPGLRSANALRRPHQSGCYSTYQDWDLQMPVWRPHQSGCTGRSRWVQTGVSTSQEPGMRQQESQTGNYCDHQQGKLVKSIEDHCLYMFQFRSVNIFRKFCCWQMYSCSILTRSLWPGDTTCRHRSEST